MSNLELLIKQSRKVWRKMKIPVKLRDEMIDSIAKIDIKKYNELTEEKIILATQKYINSKTLKTLLKGE